jgi:tetratricopeptide (TPR) repeat protein
MGRVWARTAMGRSAIVAVAAALIGIAAAGACAGEESDLLQLIRQICVDETDIETCKGAVEKFATENWPETEKASAWFYLGFALHDSDSHRAVAAYTNSIAIQPLRGARFNRAQLYRLAGESDKALADLRAVVDLDPDDGPAWLDISLISLDTKRYVEAAESARRALAIESELESEDRSKAANNLGQALRNLDRFEESKSVLKNAIVYDPANAVAHRNLVRTLIKMGEFSEARDALEVAVSIDPYSHWNNMLRHALESSK